MREREWCCLMTFRRVVLIAHLLKINEGAAAGRLYVAWLVKMVRRLHIISVQPARVLWEGGGHV